MMHHLNKYLYSEKSDQAPLSKVKLLNLFLKLSWKMYHQNKSKQTHVWSSGFELATGNIFIVCEK